MSSNTDTDPLLMHYLSLLHNYTTLRAELSTLNSQMHSHLARANFLSGRGHAYGQLDYDDRMQASLRVRMKSDGLNSESGSMELEAYICEELGLEARTAEVRGKIDEQPDDDGNMDTDEEPVKVTSSSPTHYNSALRQFAILPPPSLRKAQATAEELAMHLVPKLVALDAEMKTVEIEIRRARKRARKLEGVKG